MSDAIEEKNQPEKRSVRDLALIRLNVREYGANEMRMYLKRKGYELSEIDPVIEEFVAEGLISDARFSKIMARHSANRSKGPGYIQAKLRQKGVKLSSQEAKSLFQENSSESEMELAQRILESRYPNAAEGFKEKQRAYQGLIRRGISHDVAQLCLKTNKQ
jgi:SOS response regulatory protein OraA/RecX